MSELPDGVRLALLSVNYGSAALLEQNLRPLCEQLPELAVFITDNYSTQPEREAVRALADSARWTLLESANLGYGTGTNLAAQAAIASGATHLLLLNPDAAIGSHGIRVLAEVSLAHPRALVAPLQFDLQGRQKAPGRFVRLTDGIMTAPRLVGTLEPTPGLVPWLSAACLLVPTQLWCDVGGMPEEYFLYWEDVEFSFRALASGAELIITPNAQCLHDQGGTQRVPGATAVSRKTQTYLYYNARNRLLFAGRNLPPDHQSRWRRRSPRAALRLIRRTRGRKGALLRPEGAWSATTKGVKDGFAAM